MNANNLLNSEGYMIRNCVCGAPIQWGQGTFSHKCRVCSHINMLPPDTWCGPKPKTKVVGPNTFPVDYSKENKYD